MSDENMKGRERIWEYIHDKIETRLSELEKNYKDLNESREWKDWSEWCKLVNESLRRIEELERKLKMQWSYIKKIERKCDRLAENDYYKNKKIEAIESWIKLANEDREKKHNRLNTLESVLKDHRGVFDILQLILKVICWKHSELKDMIMVQNGIEYIQDLREKMGAGGNLKAIKICPNCKTEMRLIKLENPYYKCPVCGWATESMETTTESRDKVRIEFIKPTTDFPEAPYEGAPLWERYYYEGWKTRDMELQEELKDTPAEDITIEEVVTTANKTFKTIEKELIVEFIQKLRNLPEGMSDEYYYMIEKETLTKLIEEYEKRLEEQEK